jgi:tetratricopeptide (TPR) repeat protein
LPDHAVAVLRQAQRRHPLDFWINYQLGWTLLLTLWHPEEAVGYCQVAVAIRPGSAEAHSLLGFCLTELGALDAAIAALQQAIALDPRFELPHRHMGSALAGKGKLDEAIACFKKALELDPDDFERNLLRTSLASLEKDAEAKQRAAQEGKMLAEILRGELRPVDAGERAEFARLCLAHGYNVAAARLCQEGFADLGTPARYNAACAAALAGCGKGKDAAKLDDQERVRLRQQALTWLRADLTLRAKQAGSSQLKDRAAAEKALQHWLEDPDFAGVRGEALAKLPEVERQAWRTLWADVAENLARARAPAAADKKSDTK